MSKVMRTHTGITEWNGDYWCDSCGRRIPQVRNIDGMDFCPKCYQETFGETDKSKKISDLEAKLVEKDLRIEELEGQFAYECECNKEFVACQNENEQLKQRLEDSEKEKQEFFIKYRHWRTEGEQLKQQLAEKEKEIENYKLCRCVSCTNEYEFMLEGLVEDLEKQIDKDEQAKTEFAIQQLQRVKEEIDKSGYKFLDALWVQFVVIDQIIKELEGKCETKEV